MKRAAIGLVLTALGIVAAPALSGFVEAPAAQTAGKPATTTTWYFYTVKWGYQNEFLDLFQRNHYPVLKARMAGGSYTSVRTFQPRYHGDGRADWTFAVELVARDDAPGAPTEEELIKKLYPDQAKFREEEKRRFELLEAHWDVPLTPVDFDTRK